MGSGIINRFGIKIFVLLVLLLCLGSGYTLVYPGLPPLPAGQGWQMTFDDEFDGNSLDTTKWSPGFQVPWCPGCTGTESLKRISVSNGILTMYPTLIPGVNGIYKTSVTTYNLFEQRYGYFETRFKTTAGNGLWSGFWLLPHSLASFKADHREIDIFENLGYQPDKIYMSFWEKNVQGSGGPDYQQTYTGPDFSQGYHTLGLQWVENSSTLIWYVDGIERARTTLDMSKWNEPLYILLDTSCMYVGWGPNCDSTTPNPAYYYVDYARAYKVVHSGSQDTISPSTPTGLTATAVSSSQINLAWTASTDNVGVAGYKIYRGGAQVATSATNSYQNTGLIPSTTYTYTVSAYDAAGNTSAQSASASATTPEGPPPSANLITNPSFESSTAPWEFYSNGAATFLTTSPDSAGSQAAKISITTPGDNVQLYQADILLESDTLYKLSFKAYSNTGHDVAVFLHKHGSPYTSYGLSNQVFDLTSSWSNFSVEFTTAGFSGTVSDARLRFDLAPYDANGDQYFFDDVVLWKIDSTASVVDLDIADFLVTESISLDSAKPIEINLMIENNGTVNEPRNANVIGVQNGMEVYNQTKEVSGDGIMYGFSPYTPTAPGDIVWTVNIADDDPDLDEAIDTTAVYAKEISSIRIEPHTTMVKIGKKKVFKVKDSEKTFKAKVKGKGDFREGFEWYVNDILGGNSVVGTITPRKNEKRAIYKAPSIPPNPSTIIIIKIKSREDSSRYGIAEIMIKKEK